MQQPVVYITCIPLLYYKDEETLDNTRDHRAFMWWCLCVSYLYQIAHLGDDDGEPEYSSAMQLEEGETFFFAPRPLKNLVSVDELESLSPIMSCQVSHTPSQFISHAPYLPFSSSSQLYPLTFPIMSCQSTTSQFSITTPIYSTPMQIADLAMEDTPQLYVACGRGPRSTLRVLRHGLEVRRACGCHGNLVGGVSLNNLQRMLLMLCGWGHMTHCLCVARVT